MIRYELQPKESTIVYDGKNITLKNFTKNPFTEVWTFDLYYPDGSLLGVPITTGTSVIKGNGTPFHKLVFLDTLSANGDLVSPSEAYMYILEE